MSAPKNLIILRHGQAKTAAITDHDHSRNLTLRGREDAFAVGETLAENGFQPDYILCSTAVRTRETLEELQKSFADPIKIDYLPKIYNASEADLLLQIASVPDSVSTLLIIGHNPALYQVSLALAKDGDKQMHNNLQMQFPTCALVVINFEGSWKDISNSRSKLVFFTVPKR